MVLGIVWRERKDALISERPVRILKLILNLKESIQRGKPPGKGVEREQANSMEEKGLKLGFEK